MYGSAKNKVKFTRRAANKSVQASLSGELGVRARALFFEYEQALLKSDGDGWVYYSNQNLKASALSAQSAEPSGAGSWFGIVRSQAGAWTGGAPSRGLSALSTGSGAASAADVTTLQTDVFDGAKPALVQTSSGASVLVFAKDAEGRDSGNHTAVAYSVRADGASAWSDPVIIDDDGTADFDPSVAVSGDDVWVAWGNAKRTFTADEAVAEDFPTTVAAACEIECARISLPGGATGSLSTYAVTDDSDFDLKPQMAVAAGVPCVAWVSNAGNDALSVSGANTVMRASLDAGSDSFSAKAVRSTNLPVASLAAGQLDGGFALAFAEDSDGDLTTTSDMRLYAAGGSGGAVLQAKGGFAPRIASLGGDDALMWLEAGEEGSALQSVAQIGGAAATVVPASAGMSSDYSVISGNGSALVAFPVAKGGGADGSDIAVWNVASGTSVEPVAITGMGGYASVPCGSFAGGSLELAFLRSDVTIEDGRVRQSADLCATSVGPQPRASVADVEFDEAAMVPGGTATVSVTARNDGLADAGSGSVSVSINGAVLGSAELGSLAAGESAVVDVPIDLPASMAAGSAMCVSATIGSSSDETEVSVGKPNLALVASGAGGAVEVSVENDSGFATGATLKVLSADGETELASYDLGEVAAGDYVAKALAADEASAFGEDSLVLSVAASSDELYDSDNVQALYVGSSVLGTLDHLEVTVPTDSYQVDDALDPTTATVQAVYADGSARVVDADSYTTNASGINMTTMGSKTLTYTYEEVGIIRTADVPLTVKARDISGATVSLSQKSYTYDGAAKKPGATVKLGGVALKSGADYTVAYSGNVNAGTATVTVTGKGNYAGAARATFAIAKAANAITMKTAAVTKTGNVKKAVMFTRAAKAKGGAVKYASNSKYVTVSKAGKVTVRKNWTGTAKVTASSPASANYKAATLKSYTVKVRPGKMAVKTAANAKGCKIKATWAKMAGADKYQVRVALNAKFTKGKKTYNAAAKLASKTTGKLKKGKTYYVQVRAYDKQTKSWSAWSAAKKVKIKK